MSYPNRILTSEEYNNSTEIDVKDLHKILLKGCRYPPELENETDSTTNGKEIDNTTAVIANGHELNKI
ncbi:hypothetical protein DAPPUDRAFT_240453 [Daphnia pulex]|uniref:Uncharacterized protein n=1 Tax=Daphnia pulex TaxID=6669 RepID=E9GBK8_DAPPU|nr:hypothetical protein DAPPUDRAFT_240453 [Daphnia pulex]|eukprot:EFX82972.1 hypothetical protein DAPPUDRAFT_240453 [Daphnia pulex]